MLLAEHYPKSMLQSSSKIENNYFKVYMEEKMDKYECPCGYVYDPEEGDVENGIDPKTEFKDLPEDWVCPLCGAEKEYFELVD